MEHRTRLEIKFLSGENVMNKFSGSFVARFGSCKNYQQEGGLGDTDVEIALMTDCRFKTKPAREPRRQIISRRKKAVT